MKNKKVALLSALLACTVTFTGLSANAYADGDKSEEASSVLIAGVADLLHDFSDTPSVSGNDKQMVAASDKAAKKEEETFCGYKNLGIAGVSDTLNVRKKSTTDSEIVGKMTKHAACEIIKTSGDWTKIKSGSVKGWVKSEYLLTGEEALVIAKKEVVTVAKVTTDTLRVRKKASTDSAILSLVGEGEEFTVLGEKDGWVKVEVDDEKGYISTDFVKLSEKLTTAQSMKELQAGDGTASESAIGLVSYALQFVGNRYVWGGESLTNGVDCSGFTMKIYQRYGIYLPHSSREQPSYGRRVSASEAKPGDLFFYGSGSSINHVAIYIGNGQIVHASNHRDGIKISNAFYRTPITVARYLN